MISNQAASSVSPRSARKEALLPARRKNDRVGKEVKTSNLSRVSPRKKTPPSASASTRRRVKKGPQRDTVALTKSHKPGIPRNLIGLMEKRIGDVSPESKKRHERRNRPSFQGLTVVDGKNNDR